MHTVPSHVWKSILLQQKATLEKLLQLHRWTTISAVKLETALVTSFYAILKMGSQHLLPKSIEHQRIALTTYRPLHGDSLQLKDSPLKELYDLDHAKEAAHDCLFLCHQIVHNYILEPVLDEKKTVVGIYITSDHQHKSALYRIELQVLLDIIGRISSSDL